MFSVLHMKVGIVFTWSKTIISDFWTQSSLTHTALVLGPLIHLVIRTGASNTGSCCVHKKFMKPLLGLNPSPVNTKNTESGIKNETIFYEHKISRPETQIKL